MAIDIPSMVLGFSLGALCLFFALFLARERLVRWLCRVFLHSRCSPSFLSDGFWYSVFYRRTKEGQIRRHTHILHFGRLFNYYHAVVVCGEYHHFQLSGDVSKGQYVTGRWSNNNPRRKYRGSFQLKLHNDGDTITGKWLGWNQAEAVNTGLWAMTRLMPDELSELSIDRSKLARRQNTSIDLDRVRLRLEQAIVSERGMDRSLTWLEV
jgi:hypothetical protein